MKTLKKKHNGKIYKGGQPRVLRTSPRSSVRNTLPGSANRLPSLSSLRSSTSPSLSGLRSTPTSRMSSVLPARTPPGANPALRRNTGSRTLNVNRPPPRQPTGRNGNRPPPPPGRRDTTDGPDPNRPNPNRAANGADPNRPANGADPNRPNPNRASDGPDLPERVGSTSDILTNRFRSSEQIMTNRHANETTSMNNRHMNESRKLQKQQEQELEGVTDPAARKTIQDRHARETADMNRRHDNEANVLNRRQQNETDNLRAQRDRDAQASGQSNGALAQGLGGLGMAGMTVPGALMASQYPGPGTPGATGPPGAYSGDGYSSGNGPGGYGNNNYYGNQDGPPGGNNFVDNNGDGLDDNTGLPFDEFMELYGNDFPDEFIDEDGDGFDDNTGLSYDEFIAMQSDRLRNTGEGRNTFSLSSRSSRRIRGEILPGVPMEIEPEEYNGPKVPFQYGNIYKDAKTGFLTTQFMTRTGKGSKFYSIYGSSITEIDQAIKGFQIFSIKRDSPHGDFVEVLEDLVDKLESNIKRSQSDADRLMQSFEDLEPIHREINVKFLDLIDARTKVLIEQLAAAKSLQSQGIR